MADNNHHGVQWKVDKVRALHKMKDQHEVEQTYDEFAEYYDKVSTF